jgi:prepilin-type N-terminal cleavage/methylation domain-containing protein
MRHNDAGLSFFELLIVMVVIGLLAAIAIPMYRGQEDNVRRTEAVHDMRATAGRSRRGVLARQPAGPAPTPTGWTSTAWRPRASSSTLLYRNGNGLVEIGPADAACA